MPMIQHVWLRAKQSDASAVVVATDDQRIADVVHDFGGDVCLTSLDHPSGTDRLHDVSQQRGWANDHIVVNVQGDEPLIPVSVINQVAYLLVDQSAYQVSTLCTRILTEHELIDPNAVKVVIGAKQQALYFSRAALPFDRDQSLNISDDAMPFYRHIGLYAYRVSALKAFTAWPVASLEAREKLEQLRFLENGLGITIAQANALVPAGVDTQADLDRVRAQ